MVVNTFAWQTKGRWVDSSWRHKSPLGLHQKGQNKPLPNETCSVTCCGDALRQERSESENANDFAALNSLKCVSYLGPSLYDV